MPENKYKIYGLNIRSAFPLPELLPPEEERTDIVISLGSVPEKLASAAVHGALWQSEDDKLLLDIKDAARFLIVGAEEIIVEPYAVVASSMQKGFSMMADDKVCLTLGSDGVINVVPAFPQLRLLRQSTMRLNYPVTEAQFVPEFEVFCKNR